MYKNHIDANPNLYISIWEINDDFMMTNNLYQKLDSSIYIKYKGGDWRVIDRSFLGKYSVDGPEYPVFSPDKDKVWFYFFYTVIPDTVINGREMYKFLISYNIYKDTTSVAEETEGFPTVLPTKLYPNPAKRMVTVNFFLNPNYREKVKFEIYDYMGCKIKELDGSYSYNASEAFGSKQIDVEDISTGIYYLVIDNGSEKRSIGFAVE
jgi:hypothetical protein